MWLMPGSVPGSTCTVEEIHSFILDLCMLWRAPGTVLGAETWSELGPCLHEACSPGRMSVGFPAGIHSHSGAESQVSF